MISLQIIFATPYKVFYGYHNSDRIYTMMYVSQPYKILDYFLLTEKYANIYNEAGWKRKCFI